MQKEVGSDYVKNLLQLVKSQGGRPNELLASLDLKPNPLIDDQQLPLDADTYSRLYSRAASMIGDECFHFLGPNRLPCGTFSILCDRMLSANTLAGALQRASGFLNWMWKLQHRNAELKPHIPYVQEGGIATLYFINQSNSASSVFITQRAIASCLSSWHRFLCWLIDMPIPLVEVQFQGRCQLDQEVYQRIFQAPLVYQQKATAFMIGAQRLEAPIIQTRETLNEFLALAPYYLVGVRERESNEDSLSNQVKQLLLHNDSNKLPGIESTAKRIGLSSRNLREALGREGSCFQELRNEARLQTSMMLLRVPTMDLEEIARNLGFADTSTFASSFNDQAGLSPEQYRERWVTTETA